MPRLRSEDSGRAAPISPQHGPGTHSEATPFLSDEPDAVDEVEDTREEDATAIGKPGSFPVVFVHAGLLAAVALLTLTVFWDTVAYIFGGHEVHSIFQVPSIHIVQVQP